MGCFFPRVSVSVSQNFGVSTACSEDNFFLVSSQQNQQSALSEYWNPWHIWGSSGLETPDIFSGSFFCLYNQLVENAGFVTKFKTFYGGSPTSHLNSWLHWRLMPEYAACAFSPEMFRVFGCWNLESVLASRKFLAAAAGVKLLERQMLSQNCTISTPQILFSVTCTGRAETISPEAESFTQPAAQYCR